MRRKGLQWKDSPSPLHSNHLSGVYRRPTPHAVRDEPIPRLNAAHRCLRLLDAAIAGISRFIILECILVVCVGLLLSPQIRARSVQKRTLPRSGLLESLVQAALLLVFDTRRIDSEDGIWLFKTVRRTDGSQLTTKQVAQGGPASRGFSDHFFGRPQYQALCTDQHLQSLCRTERSHGRYLFRL